MDDQQPEKKRRRKNANPNARQPPRKAAASRPDAVEARRRGLVQAAFEIIAEYGFEGLRTRDTAIRAGMTVTTLQYYFEGKEALVQSVGEYLKKLLQPVPFVLPDHNASLETPQHFFTSVLLPFQQEPKALVVLCEFSLRALRDPLLRPVVEELNQNWRRGIRAALEEGIERKFVPADIDIEATTSLAVAFVQGAALQATTTLDFDIVQASRQFEALLRA